MEVDTNILEEHAASIFRAEGSGGKIRKTIIFRVQLVLNFTKLKNVTM
jgi:hypothetical protein